MSNDTSTIPFVADDSIVRQIWGNSDTILVIFAGAAAEFALNKAVDWLYFTGKLPQDPLGRLFSTVNYAKVIVFAKRESALKAIDKITSIHNHVENARGQAIPNWAYKDVLYMLIDYSIKAYELLQRPLNYLEKEEVFSVFYKVGLRMKLKDLPRTYEAFEKDRTKHINENLSNSDYTQDLYKQYRKHLGFIRFFLLLETQRLVLPPQVKLLLWKRRRSLIAPLIGVYKFLRIFNLDNAIKALILPRAYKKEIQDLNYLK